MRIFVIEDHPVFLQGLKSSFSESRNKVVVAGSSSNLADGIKTAAGLNFDVFLLDLYLAESDPLDNIKTLKKIFPDKPVVILTSEIKSIWKYRTAVAGAAGYIQKDAGPKKILEVLRQVNKGISTISASDFIPKPGEVPFLTPDQQEIAILLAQGLSLKDIESETKISIPMIEKNLRTLRKNFNMNTNAGLIHELTRQGLI